MRIAVIYLGRRGAGGIISLELARHLGQAHQALAVLSAQAENLARWPAVQTERVEVDTFNNALGALASLLFPNQINSLAEQIRQSQPDVLLFPMFHPWNSRIQRILRDIPSVVFVHDPRPHPDLSGWFYEKLENASLRRASRCVVLSESLRPFLTRRGVDPSRVDVVPLGPFLFPSSVQPVNDQSRTPTLFFFGRIMPYKGLEILLDAFAKVRESTQCRLLLVGEGNLTPFKESLASLQDVEVVNRWIAEDEIADFFARSDLVVLPYTSASQSGVIPIAATFGLPVIATRTGGLAEQVEDGVSGWLVPPGDAEALAEAIAEALSEAGEARQRGQRLKDRYETLFGWEQVTRRVVKSLEMAAPARGPE